MPSGRSRRQPDPEELTFFLDRGIGRHVVAATIRELGYRALPMVDIYPDGADERVPDDEWMIRASAEGWVALTKDYSIIRDHAEKPGPYLYVIGARGLDKRWPKN